MADYKLDFTSAEYGDTEQEEQIDKNSIVENGMQTTPTPSEPDDVPDPPPRSSSLHATPKHVDCTKTHNRPLIAWSLLLLILITSCTCRGYVQGIIMLVTHFLQVGLGNTSTVPLSFHFGIITAIMFVSYNGGKRHRTRWISVGTIFIGLGALISTLGYFISKDEIDKLGAPSLAIELCNASEVNNSKNGDHGPETPTLSWLSIGLIMCGFGAAPQISLGLTYICDTLPVKYTPMYIVAIYAAEGLGLVLGELMSFSMRSEIQSITHEPLVWGSKVMDHWWIGFCVLGLIVLALGLVILTFRKIETVTDDGECPEVRRMCKRHETFGKYRQLAEEVSLSSASRVRPKTIVRLLQNPTLLSSCAAYAFEGAILCGIYQFLPPFLERDYSIEGGVADVKIAISVVFGLVIGGTIAALVLIRGQVSQLKQLCRSVLVFGLLSWGLYWTFFSPHCDGINISPFKDGTANLTTCHSCSDKYFPVCGSNGVVYASPCYAGCSQGNYTNFENCSFSRGNNGSAVAGVCSANCDPMWSILLLLFFAATLTGIQNVPATLVVLRCVSHSDRSVAVGLVIFVTYVLGILPAVLYFPAILQPTCMLSQPSDKTHLYECLAYDSVSFRFIFFGTLIVLKFLSIVCFTITWCSTRTAPSVRLNDHSSVKNTYVRFGMDGYDETCEL
ncbi:solute carrier organic anion transporter family member 5A1-like [Antedon mediterranea]|uniref:solute carrier organic anion transporter family member 5A1-like n=1 Tax=Antedon mediterranea TaxID=105859 RepID=UPI003AF8ECD2